MFPIHCFHFNPHEREARDFVSRHTTHAEQDFNPHEREARDLRFMVRASCAFYFNPHEREARDGPGVRAAMAGVEF